MKLIQGKKKPKYTLTDAQKATCYLRMFQDGMMEYRKTQSRWALAKAVYNSVRMININCRVLSNAEFVPVDVWKGMFKTYKSMELLMSLMTPEEIIRTFPITKTYDGNRWQCADYFSSLNLFADISMNLSLFIQDKQPFDILFGYQNPHICMFFTGMMGTVDNVRMANGEDDMLTAFFKEQGIKPPHKMTMHKDADGKQYMMDEDGNKRFKKAVLKDLKYPIYDHYPKGDNSNYVLGDFLKPQLIKVGVSNGQNQGHD